MISRKSKIYGYVLEDGEWLEFSKFNIPIEEDKLRIWKDDYKKRIHVKPSLDSPLIFYKPKYKTFSYFRGHSHDVNGNDSPLTFSHIFRQKVLSNMETINFEISKIINSKRRRKEHLDFKIEIEKVFIEERVYDAQGNYKTPDIIVEFQSPISLAIKWNNKIYIEIVESSHTRGDKIKFLEQFGHPILEIPPQKSFNYLKLKSILDVTHNDVQALEEKISNFFNKAVWADLLYDPISIQYEDRVINNHYNKENVLLRKKVLELESEKNQLDDNLFF